MIDHQKCYLSHARSIRMCVSTFTLALVLIYAGILSAVKLEYFPKNTQGAKFELKNILWYDHDNYDEANELEEEVNRKLKDYRDPPNREKLMNCDFQYEQRSDLICSPADLRHLYPCTKENHYGYRNGTPCVFVAIEKEFGWVPEPYDDVTKLPDDMPQDIKDEIAKRARERPEALNTAWITCEGENPVDRENIGTVTYFPDRGFNGYYFPYKNIEGYLSPFVALLFNNLQRSVLLNVKCKIWAKNVKHQDGTLRFQLMVD